MSESIPLHYCPICGDHSEIQFIEETTAHAEWICKACDEHIEVYILDTEESEDDEQEMPQHAFPFIIVIVILIGYIYVTL